MSIAPGSPQVWQDVRGSMATQLKVSMSSLVEWIAGATQRHFLLPARLSF